MFGLGVQELLIILIIILLLFGSKKLPELSRSLGESLREIRKGLTEDTSSSKKNSSDHKEDKS